MGNVMQDVRGKQRLWRWGTFGGLSLAAITLTWMLFVWLPRWYGPGPSTAAAPAAGAPATEHRKIRATLFYVADDGLRLDAVETEVPFGEDTVTQARHIVEAQLAPASERVSAIPRATRLRSVYVTPRGEAFVDFSAEISRGHGGGSLQELFTVYTVVNALTLNLPAISSVQLLVDGKEVETLAGHVDLRQPLPKNLSWIKGNAPG